MNFKTLCETATGADLEAFSNEWVYQAGYPEYEYAWNTFSDGARFVSISTSTRSDGCSGVHHSRRGSA